MNFLVPFFIMRGVYSQRSPSATAAGEPSSAGANEQRISQTLRERKGRRLLAAGSGLNVINETCGLLPSVPQPDEQDDCLGRQEQPAPKPSRDH